MTHHFPNIGHRHALWLDDEQFQTLERALSWDEGWPPLFFAMKEHAKRVGLPPVDGHRIFSEDML